MLALTSPRQTLGPRSTSMTPGPRAPAGGDHVAGSTRKSTGMSPLRSRVPRRPLAAVTTLAVALTTVLTSLAVTASPSAAATLDEGLVARYPLTQTTGTTATDSSGHGRDATVSGDTTWTGSQGLRLGGTNGHLRLPNDLMRGLTDITVSTQVRIDPAQATPYFVWGLGNTTSGAGNGYLFTTGNAYRTSIASGNWSTEQTTTAGRNVDRDQWRTLTYTLGGGTGILYEDGVEVGRRTGITITPGSIGGGTTTANYLGRSVYTDDRYLRGDVRDFRVYDRALAPDEVKALGAETAALRVSADAAALGLGDTTAVTDDLSLSPRGAGGSTISWSSSDESVVATDGTVTRPVPGAGNATVTLTATIAYAAASATKSFTVTVLQDSTDQAKVDAALAAVSIPDADAVHGNLTLPTSGARG
ncbi:MAG: LamG domain-containing protein, partial [Terrabacter sp.]|nr:LamG domain-containing protein [Terrabacter sp.]